MIINIKIKDETIPFNSEENYFKLEYISNDIFRLMVRMEDISLLNHIFRLIIENNYLEIYDLKLSLIKELNLELDRKEISGNIKYIRE